MFKNISHADKEIKSIYLTYYKIRCIHIISQAIYLSSFSKFLIFMFNSSILLTSISPDASRILLTFFVISLGLLFEFMLELTTSKFADKGRKKSSILIYSNFFNLFSLILCFCFYKHHILVEKHEDFSGLGLFIVIIIAQFFYMLSQTFLSGALEAWAVNSIRIKNKEFDYTNLFTSSNFFESICWIIGGVIGLKSFIPGQETLFGWISICVLMIFCAIATIENVDDDKVLPEDDSLPQVRNGIRFSLLFSIKDEFFIKAFGEIKKSKNLMFLTIIQSISYMMWVIIWYLWPIIRDFTQKNDSNTNTLVNFAGYQVDYVSPVSAWVAYCIARIIGSLASYFFKNYDNRFILVVASLCNSIPILMIGYYCSQKSGMTTLGLIFMLFVSKVGESLIIGLRKPFLNKAIHDDNYRAILNSISNFFGSFFAFICLIAAFIGIIYPAIISKGNNEISGLQSFGGIFLFLGSISLISAFMYFMIKQKMD